MSQTEDKPTKKDRREFLKEAGIASLAVPMVSTIASGCDEEEGGCSNDLTDTSAEAIAAWNEQGYFVHETVDASRFEQGEISAFIDGTWQTFHNRQFSDGFLNWNSMARLAVIHQMMEDPMGGMCLDGPHSGALATYGQSRGDSRFSLNNAFKGFGLCPKEDRIDETIETVMGHWSADMETKAGILESFYLDQDKWDRRLLDSIELYSNATFCTHSFLNQLSNPIATIVFLAIPGSYEVRAIPRMVHPDDPNLSESDYKKLRWVDMIHDFFHGGPYPSKPSRIGVFYYVVEEFDNSPAPYLMGLRTVPPL